MIAAGVADGAACVAAAARERTGWIVSGYDDSGSRSGEGGGVRSGRVCCILVSWSICRAIKRSELKRSNILDLSIVVCDIVGILLKSLQKG